MKSSAKLMLVLLGGMLSGAVLRKVARSPIGVQRQRVVLRSG